LEPPVSIPHPAKWLIRISEVFANVEKDVIQDLDGKLLKKLGREYFLIETRNPEAIRQSNASKFIRWNLPLHHSWPCCPKDTTGFIEKAAQALVRKFGDSNPQTIIVGPLDPSASSRYYKTLASNLRGRALQLFPRQASAIRVAEEQDRQAPTLFCLVGKEGLFCGLQSPAESNGFYPGGTKYIRQNGPETISRAGAKVAEALHHMRLHRMPPSSGSHWLELGASPGGMTAELLARGYQVTAVDRAPLDRRLARLPGLTFKLVDAGTFQPERGTTFDAMLSDMNGDAMDAIRHVIRLSRFLRKSGLVIFTLKLPGVTSYAETNNLESKVLTAAATAGLKLFGRTHLSFNRHEFTLFFEFQPPV
jgi:23S rRNA C2498 (ribose-2'-O)-methylase RlmM